MKKVFKNLHRNRIISLFVWLIVVFVAIITTPAITDTVQNYGQPVFDKSSQTSQADQIKSHWGYGLGKADSLDIVYNNQNSAIKPQQQAQIDKVVKKLRKDHDYYDIKKIVTLKTNVAGKKQLLSPDHTTEIVNISLNSHKKLTTLAQQISQDSSINGLSSYVTSPKLIRETSAQKNIQTVKIILIALFIASMLIIGVYFHSILLPLVSLVTLFSTYVVSLAINLNLATHHNFAITEFTPLEIGLAVLILGTIWNIYLFRKLKMILEFQSDPIYATKQTISALRFPVTVVGLTLTIAFGLLHFIKYQAISSLAAVGITYLILTLAVLTINPIFTGALGESIFWPANKPIKNAKARYWTKAADFSLSKPLAGLIVVLYLTVPFIYNYHQSTDYSPVNNLISNDQAVTGAKVLNTHFSDGKATPVTIYLENNRPLDNEKYLQQVDALTNKLQSAKNVNAVYSVTQPSGMPISKYYVANQLDSISNDVKGSASVFTKIAEDIDENKENLDLEQLQEQISEINDLKNQAGSLESSNNSVTSQINKAATKATDLQTYTLNSKKHQYQRDLDNLDNSLIEASSNIDELTSQATSIKSYGETIYVNLKTYKKQLQKVKNSLNEIKEEADEANQQLNDVYSYLNGLQKSTAANVYYITKSQLADTDFLQSMYNYTSENKKITKLQVVFNNSANNKDNLKEIQNLQTLVQNQIQGTTLKHAKFAMTGEPVVEAQLQNGMQHYLKYAIAILIIVTLLAVFILSRAILQPIYWTFAFIISVFTGIQLTHITMHYLIGTGKLDWQVMPIMIATVTAVAVWQIIGLGLSFRYTTLSILDWIRPTVASYGQVVRYMLVVIVAIGISLTFGKSYLMISVSLIAMYTFAIYYLVLPMIISSFGKWSVTLPSKSHLIK